MNKKLVIARIDAIEAELRSCEVRLTLLRHELAKEWLILAEPEKPRDASRKERLCERT